MGASAWIGRVGTRVCALVIVFMIVTAGAMIYLPHQLFFLQCGSVDVRF
jgi:hypothetical protein